jgi:hypothetical protein
MIFQILENLPSQFHGGTADGNTPLGNARFFPHLLGDIERLFKQLVQDHPRGTERTRRIVGILHLPQNLGFAQHHRIQTGRHTEQVLHRTFILIAVKIFIQFLGADIVVIADEIFKKPDPFCRVIDTCVYFHPVAGRQDDVLDDLWIANQPFQ